jgi:hypothetical protein
MNNIHKYLEFKLTEEENNNVTYLGLSIHRNNNDIHLDIHRKPTQTDMIYDMIHLLTAVGFSPGGSTHLHTNNT